MLYEKGKFRSFLIILFWKWLLVKYCVIVVVGIILWRFWVEFDIIFFILLVVGIVNDYVDLD